MPTGEENVHRGSSNIQCSQLSNGERFSVSACD
jgi:hypothetical protein